MRPVRKADNLATSMCRMSRIYEILNLLDPYGACPHLYSVCFTSKLLDARLACSKIQTEDHKNMKLHCKKFSHPDGRPGFVHP